MSRHLFLMQLDRHRYALHLQGVLRVVRMVEIASVPKASPSMLGVVNVQGEVLPVMDLRRCLGHAPRPVEPGDVLVIALGKTRKLALVADAVLGVVELPESGVRQDAELMRDSPLLEGVVKLGDGLVMVCDLERIAACGEEAGAALLPAPEPREAATAAAEAPERERDQDVWRSVLRERAQKLAREPASEDGASRLELVEFTLSNEAYAIESGYIREVYPLKELTQLPCTPPFVLGVVNLRGKILSVIDIRTFFQLPERGLSDLNRVIVLEGGRMVFGILADAIVGVRTVDARELQPTLPTLTGIRGDYLKGITRERLVVLDAEKMLTDRRIVVREEV